MTRRDLYDINRVNNSRCSFYTRSRKEKFLFCLKIREVEVKNKGGFVKCFLLVIISFCNKSRKSGKSCSSLSLSLCLPQRCWRSRRTFVLPLTINFSTLFFCFTLYACFHPPSLLYHFNSSYVTERARKPRKQLYQPK